MGDITSTCCNGTTQLNDMTGSRLGKKLKDQHQIVQQDVFMQITASTQETFKQVRKCPYYNKSSNQQELDSQLFSKQKLITLHRKQKQNNSLLSFLGGFRIYLKKLPFVENKVQQQQNQTFNGKYLIYLPNHKYFLGTLKDGSPTNGIFIFQQNCYFVGNIKDFHADGEGKYLNKQNGYCYQGSWSKNLQHGKGKEQYQNGDIFQGQFMYGSKFGEGVYQFSNGKVYKGYFYNGHSDGIGKLIISKDQWYEGEWKLGSIQGKGQYHYKNGDVYHGQFENGIKSGNGKYIFNEGCQYEGEWFNGKMHGQGVVREGYDQIWGEWQNGVKIK